MNSKRKITFFKVLYGLKFIAENQALSDEEIKNGLLDLGCDFTFEDINNVFQHEFALVPGMNHGNLASGASVIANVKEGGVSRTFINEVFLSTDNNTSIYHFIRLVTGDNSYTKENIDVLDSNVKYRK